MCYDFVWGNEMTAEYLETVTQGDRSVTAGGGYEYIGDQKGEHHGLGDRCRG